jgi:hypothetical protein
MFTSFTYPNMPHVLMQNHVTCLLASLNPAAKGVGNQL